MFSGYVEEMNTPVEGYVKRDHYTLSLGHIQLVNIEPTVIELNESEVEDVT